MDPSEVTPDEAVAALAAANTTMRRSRRRAVTKWARTSLVFWGVAWMIAYASMQLLPPSQAVIVSIAVGTTAFLLTRWRARTSTMASGTVSGWEAQFHRTWWVLFFGSVALGIIVAPAAPAVSGLASGTLWGIAFLIYAVLTGDRPAGVLGASIVFLAVVLRITLANRALLPFGLGAGGGMALLGLMRTVREP